MDVQVLEMASRVPNSTMQPLDADDVLYSGSDDEYYDSPQERQRQYETQAQSYMDGKPPIIFSAQLKGPFDRKSGWVNPWRSRRQAGKERSTKPSPATQSTPATRHDSHPNRESIVVPETTNHPKVPTLLNNTSYGNVSSGFSSRKRQAGSSSFQLPSPVSSASQPRPINPWMDDEAWGRVQAWREAVKPGYGSGEEVHIENKPLSPSLLGRKRPAVADFLRKALASSKRLKASELQYSTRATPSPVKRSLPIQQPDSSGTHGPVLPSSQDWTSVSGNHGFTTFSHGEAVTPREEQKVLPLVKAPLVDYSSSYNTVTKRSPVPVLPLQTPTNFGTPAIQQESAHEDSASPIRESSESHLQPSFEQRLLLSHKVRLGTGFRRSGTAPVDSRQRTPLGSPPANFTTPRHATQSSLPASARGIVGTTIETSDEQELEFESHADRSFQFRVKVSRHARTKDVLKQETNCSRLNMVCRASSDNRVPEPPSPAYGGVDKNSGRTPMSLAGGNESDPVSEDETTSEASLPQDRGPEETTGSRLAVDNITGCMENNAVLSAVELSPVAEEGSDHYLGNTNVGMVELSKIKKEKSPDGDLVEDVRTTFPINGRLAAVPSSSPPRSVLASQHDIGVTPGNVVDDPLGDEVREVSPAHLPRNLDQSTPSKDARRVAASSPYVADLGGHHMLPALALSFSPLSSFFGTRGDDGPSTEVQVVEKVIGDAGQDVLEQPDESACKVRARSLPATSPIPLKTPAGHETSNNRVLTGPLNIRLSPESPQLPAWAVPELQDLQAETSDGDKPAADRPHSEPNSADAMQADKRAGSSPPPLSSPQPASELEKSTLETPHQQSPWTKDSIATMQATTAADDDQIEPKRKPQDTTTPADLNEATVPAPHIHKRRSLAEQHPVEGTVVPSVQSPWAGTILSPNLPIAQLIDDATFSSRQCHLPLIRPVQDSESQTQNPWRQDVNLTPAKMLVSSPTRDHDNSAISPLEHRNHISHAPPYFPNQLSSPVSAHGSTPPEPKQLSINQDMPMSDIALSTQHRPSTPSRIQSSLPTPDFTLSVKSFREFATPSPVRRRMRPPGGHQTRSILKSTGIRYSDMAFPSHMRAKPPPRAKRVSFASELARSPSSSSFADETTTLGVELPTMEATRTPPRRNPERSFSPPLQLSQSELPGSTDRFYSHFAKMLRKGPQMRRKSRSPVRTGRSKLLPSASQQVLGSPGLVDMAEAFIAADSMRPDPEGDDVDTHEPGDQGEEMHEVDMGRGDEEEEQEGVEEGDEDQYETDPVAHVLGNLDAFIGAFDVDLELSKARLVEDQTQENDSRPVYFPDIASQELDREVTGRGVWN